MPENVGIVDSFDLVEMGLSHRLVGKTNSLKELMDNGTISQGRMMGSYNSSGEDCKIVDGIGTFLQNDSLEKSRPVDQVHFVATRQLFGLLWYERSWRCG
jgi:hypothetical protein